MEFFDFNNPFFLAIFVVTVSFLAVWDIVWKAIALWKSARNNHFVWFICILIINTVGILPIIYILLNKDKTK